MKIVQIITELRPGGAERVLVELCRGLIQRGHNVTVIALRPLPAESVIINDLKELGVTILSVGLRKLQPWRIFSIKKLLDAIKPDIVHSHLFHANLTARLNGFGRKYKLVNTVHTTEVRDEKKWYFWLDKLTLNYCDCQTAVSEAARDFHAEHLGIQHQSMPIIYNGIIAPSRPSPEETASLRAGWCMDDCSSVIGSVGRLGHEKGFDLLLKSTQKISEHIPEGEKWGIVIIGEGLERENLEKLAAQAPSNVKIQLPGFRRDAARCIGAFDLFIMPSRYEGFGLVLIEAMSHGVPVITSDIGPLRELLKNYPNGKYFNFQHSAPEELGKEILSLLTNSNPGLPDLSFTSDKMVEDYLHLYNDLLEN
jgi:glycosyltransferase involved in cell wall biosynthesis